MPKNAADVLDVIADYLPAGDACAADERARELLSALDSAGYEVRRKVPDNSDVPDDSWAAFAFFVSKCASGFCSELLEQGKTETQARNTVIGCFLQMAAGEACRVARKEGRDPDPSKWRAATDSAFERAVAQTARPTPEEG